MQTVTKMPDPQRKSPSLRPVNEIVLEQLRAVHAVSEQLVAEGHTVINAQVDPAGGIPTVQLAASIALHELVAQDRAAYYKRQTDEAGSRYQTGQFQRSHAGVNVRVLWLDINRH